MILSTNESGEHWAQFSLERGEASVDNLTIETTAQRGKVIQWNFLIGYSLTGYQRVSGGDGDGGGDCYVLPCLDPFALTWEL